MRRRRIKRAAASPPCRKPCFAIGHMLLLSAPLPVSRPSLEGRAALPSNGPLLKQIILYFFLSVNRRGSSFCRYRIEIGKSRYALPDTLPAECKQTDCRQRRDAPRFFLPSVPPATLSLLRPQEKFSARTTRLSLGRLFLFLFCFAVFCRLIYYLSRSSTYTVRTPSSDPPSAFLLRLARNFDATCGKRA